MFEGHRVTSMALEALDDIQEANLTRPMAEEQNINCSAYLSEVLRAGLA